MDTADNTSRFDQFYLKEDHATKPKEYFKRAAEILEPRIRKDDSLIDIGCAAGDFLRYLSARFPSVRLHGLDAFEPLIREAQSRVPGGTFHCRDLNAPSLEIAQKFKFVTMLGTISILTTTQWIRNFASLLAEDGYGLIFGLVNPYPYDVFVRLQRSGSGKDEYGWNAWSAETLQREFKTLGWKADVEYWQLPIEIPQRESEPLRSWTTDLKGGGKMVTNGARIIHDFAFVKISR